MNILCLDLGTKTGWCILNNTLTSGTKNFTIKKNKSTPKNRSRFFNSGEKYKNFYNWLNTFNNITEVYFEEVWGHKGVSASHAYGGYLAILTMWCYENNLPYTPVGVGTIKKTITGKGNANKEDVIAVIKNFGFNPIDDNEADAIALAYYVSEIINNKI
jgi:Holliday junction resolvasome RuvABC endonuclease subunit